MTQHKLLMLQSYYLKLNCHSWVHVLSSLSLAMGVLLKGCRALKDGSWLAEVGHQGQALQVDHPCFPSVLSALWSSMIWTVTSVTDEPHHSSVSSSIAWNCLETVGPNNPPLRVFCEAFGYKDTKVTSRRKKDKKRYFGPQLCSPKWEGDKDSKWENGGAQGHAFPGYPPCQCLFHSWWSLPSSLASQERVQYSTQDSEKQQAAPIMRIPYLRTHFWHPFKKISHPWIPLVKG